MYEVYALKNIQHDTVSYISSVDIRKIAPHFEEILIGGPQQAQRPLKKTKIEEIARTIADRNGISSGNIVFGVVTEHIVPEEVIPGVYKIAIPEPGDPEFELIKEELGTKKNNLIGSLMIPDGQHRAMSFTECLGDQEGFCRLNKDEVFNMSVSFYFDPRIEIRRRIFYENTKQDKISTSLRHAMEYQLGMSNEDTVSRYEVIRMLDTINNSPLKGLISFDDRKFQIDEKGNYILDQEGKKVRVRYTEASILNDFKVARIIETVDKILEKGKKTISAQTRAESLCAYLSAIEDAIGFSFATNSFPKGMSDSMEAKASKKGFLDIIIRLYPVFANQAKSERRKANAAFMRECIEAFELIKGDKLSILVAKTCNAENARKDFIRDFETTINRRAIEDDFDIGL